MTARIERLHVWPEGEAAPVEVDRLVLDWGGPVSDRHHGVVMTSDSRQKWLYPQGTQIRNNRQVSVVDAGDLVSIAANLGLPGLAPGTIAGGLVEARYGTAPEKFPKAAMGVRGVTGWVERPGVVTAGMPVRVVPTQPAG